MSLRIKVRDAMSFKALKLNAKQSVEEAAQALLDNNLQGAPVVNERDELIGFVSEKDVLVKVLGASYHGSSNTHISDLMREEVLTVSPEDDLVELTELIVRDDKPKIYPVVEEGKLLGVITRSLVLQALVKNINKQE